MNENNESIFDISREETKPVLNPKPTEHDGGGLSDMLNKLSSTLLKGMKADKNTIKQEDFDKFIAQNGEFLFMLTSCDCKIKFTDKYLELQCEPLNLTGKIFMGTKDQFQPDENATKIFKYIANIANKMNGMELTMNRLEKEGFFPVGELKKQTVNVEGKPTEVMVGTLKNDKGETRTIYFNNGTEITPDK